MTPDFVAASKACESWCNLLSELAYFAQRGESMMALDCAVEVIHGWEKHGSTILDHSERLAVVSDGLVRHHGLTGLNTYASGHAAICDLAFACQIALGPLLDPKQPINLVKWRAAVHRQIGKVWELLAVTQSESSLLKARIIRERAKLVASNSSTLAIEPSP